MMRTSCTTLSAMSISIATLLGMPGFVLGQTYGPQPAPRVQGPQVQGPQVQGPQVQGPQVQNRQPQRPQVQNPRVAGPLASSQGTPAIGGPPAPQPPIGFPLAPKAQQYVDTLLNHWEAQSRKIRQYQCTFERFEYDPVYGPKFDPQLGEIPASRISQGELKYSSPDKGMFRVNKITHHQAASTPGQRPTYVERPGAAFEHWVCDGKSVFEFNTITKQLIQWRLPREMQSNQIVRSPLPFVFGANASEIKQRYWVQVVTPAEAAQKKEFWLEAFPKRAEDAAAYKFVLIIIDETFLPKAIRIYMPNYDRRLHGPCTSFVFENRKGNWLGDIRNKLDPFYRAFYEPGLPDKSWKRLVKDFPVAGANVAPAGPPQQTLGPNVRR